MNEIDASPLAAIRFRLEDDRLCVACAPPVAWFALHALELAQPNPEVGLSFDGTLVTLHAHNGEWMWKLTGRSRLHRYGTDGEPVVMVEGRWPD